ncbi:MAG: Qat anti-phage system ATPase QatA [Blautia sp.]|uniref:Qat anti-phage system ATPase QatA n=1 Tax=Lachnospiraceae TaxID=186803 RepID=UPI00203FE0B2|nr:MULTISPECIES: Qat anti-phage system ATPase QatA [Lachnospiraceae]MEE1443442.1 Qat anti-phage system ATPase QatA [Blautia sp.]
MILSDNETKVDLLNNEAIAKTIVSLIKDSKEQPISVGIHGDWGAGKSSILEMVENEVNKSPSEDGKKYSCIRFNGWRHQGFEDSKVALMSSIVSELQKKETLGAKAGETLKKLWKNINWMSVAKATGKTALGIATGTAPITLLSSAMDVLKSTVTTEEGIAGAIESIGGYLHDAKITEDTSSNKEFSEFQENFAELLESASIKKLVVLIDDLDRCLPDVAINTLEAVRLFMFSEKTAFVIAADESMIRYAVKKHFPDAINEHKINAGDTFANKYLEKLIQVPFRIPALGEVESCIYIMILMVGSVLTDENENYKKLREEGLSRIKKPWNVEIFTVDDVKVILGNDYEKCSDEVLIATQICHLLAQHTDGNPRKIKRFINMLLLRYEIAKNRGFDDELELAILAKMMLVEYYESDFYKALPNHLDSEGKWNEIPEILADIEAMAEDKKMIESKEQWYDLSRIWKWLTTEPGIMDKDLRPYYYACKEKIDYFSGATSKNDLSEIVDLLFRDEMTVVGRIDDLKNLTNQEAEQVFEVIVQKIMERGQFETKPKGIDGVIVLVQNKTELRENLVNFMDTIPADKAGIWIIRGWDKAIPKDCAERKGLERCLDKLKTSGTEIVKNALKNM